MNSFKIIADSSADLLSISGTPYEVAPLKIIAGEREFTDNKDLDVNDMVTYLLNYKGRSSTSCPSPSDWLEAFGDAENVFCVTITGTLSGSYNAAENARSMYLEEHPDRNVLVINSLSAGSELILIVDKLNELISEGKDFDTICREITAYTKKTGLLFVLESMKNLANNGRVSPLVAKMAGLLGIRVVGRASDKGDLEQLNKCRGEAKTLETVVEHLKNFGLKNGRVIINHCFNAETANKLKALIEEKIEKAKVMVGECRGLCSFYAEKGGLMIGFEKA